MYTLNTINEDSIKDMLTQEIGTPVVHKGISFADVTNAIESFGSEGEEQKMLYPNLPGTELFQEYGPESGVLLRKTN